jgi:hypothetical protein
LGVVTSVEYLGSSITKNGDTIKETRQRTSIALQKFKQLKKLWDRTDGTTNGKVKKRESRKGVYQEGGGGGDQKGDGFRISQTVCR